MGWRALSWQILGQRPPQKGLCKRQKGSLANER